MTMSGHETSPPIDKKSCYLKETFEKETLDKNATLMKRCKLLV